MADPIVFNRCVGTMAKVCIDNALIYAKMAGSRGWSKDQLDTARQTAEKSLVVLDGLILQYLRSL